MTDHNHQETAMSTTIAKTRRYESTPCTRCGCKATATIVPQVRPRLLGPESHDRYDWDAPDPACDCDCHFAYRMIHRLPQGGAA